MDSKRILDAVFDDLIVVNSDMTVIYATEGFEKNYNVKKSEVIGRNVSELEDAQIFNPSVAKKVFETKEHIIMSQTNKEGKYLIIHGVPVFDENGEVLFSVSYSVSRHEIEELQKENEKLLNLLDEYKIKLEELQHYMKHGMTDLQGSKFAMECIDKIKAYDVSVLFTGESGVGKTTFARYLHDSSNRAEGPFVEISCGAIPENLLESELFGYESGSFTGAKKDGKKGLIEMADKGTLFLDEIGELPLRLQAKLLKVLQSKSFTSVGGVKEKSVDFRLVTATNKDLEKMVKTGEFREDLLYRINVITIDIPPLRERPEDCISLIKYFTDELNLRYNTQKTLDRQCIEKLCEYSWPGNIREMKNCIERLILLSDSELIAADSLPYHIRCRCEKTEETPDGSEKTLPQKTLSERLEEYERQIITEAAKSCRSSSALAEALGISQPTAYRKMKKYLGEFSE